LIDELGRDRDQLWAEAMATYRAGLPWWLETALLVRKAEDEQQSRFEDFGHSRPIPPQPPQRSHSLASPGALVRHYGPSYERDVLACIPDIQPFDADLLPGASPFDPA
jgi:hypothetical protein